MTAPDLLRLRVFPSSDADFRRDVERALLELPRDLADAELRDLLAGAMRPWYRSIEIVIQDELGHLSLDPTRTWYVYRDGRLRPPNARRDRLYAALASARRTREASVAALDDARAAARQAGYVDWPSGDAHAEAPPSEAQRRQSERRTSRSV